MSFVVGVIHENWNDGHSEQNKRNLSSLSTLRSLWRTQVHVYDNERSLSLCVLHSAHGCFYRGFVSHLATMQFHAPTHTKCDVASWAPSNDISNLIFSLSFIIPVCLRSGDPVYLRATLFQISGYCRSINLPVCSSVTSEQSRPTGGTIFEFVRSYSLLFSLLVFHKCWTVINTHSIQGTVLYTYYTSMLPEGKKAGQLYHLSGGEQAGFLLRRNV
jgi:hypothetical protein